MRDLLKVYIFLDVLKATETLTASMKGEEGRIREQRWWWMEEKEGEGEVSEMNSQRAER